jgi:hypothetical protein
MRWRRHASSIAVVVLAAFAVGYAYLDRGSVTENEKKARSTNAFPAWRGDDLVRIAIEHGGEHIVLERQKDDAGEPEWWMRAPQAEKANQDAVDKLASALQYASVARKVDPGANVAMDTPRATGEIGMGAVTYRFALGGEAKAPEGAAYLRVDGLGTDVVSRDVATAILQGSDAYRSRTLVPYLSVQLARLDVKNESGGFAITRVDDVSFELGSGLRASRDKLDGVWSALAEMRAESFLDDATAAAHVASPRDTVTMTPKEAARPAGVLRVGDACPGSDTGVVVVRDAPTKLSACAPKGILDGLAVTESALVDTHLFAAHDDEVAELRIETLPRGSSGPAIELARKESAWREKAPVDRDLSGEDADAASALVTAVARAEGTSPQKSDAPFAAKARVTIHRADGDATEVVEVGAPDASGDAVVRRAFDGAQLHVTAAVARKLVPSEVALRGREVWSPPIEGAPVLAVETHCDGADGVDQRAVRDGAAWSLRAPAGYAADNASVLDVIDTVQRLRAESWTADADDGHFGFGACTLALELAGDAGPRVVRIDLGKDGEGGVYAKASDGPAVFVAPKVLRERARGWLIDLHGLAPPNVAVVTLERDGKRLAFSSDAGDDATDDVLRAANVLRADSVVHLGPARPAEGLAHPALTITLHGPDGSRTIAVGAPLASDEKMRQARIPGVDATFAIEAGRLRAFFDRF